MKTFTLILFLFSINITNGQNLNTIVFDESADQDIILGYCNRDGLNTDPFNIWFQPEYDSYEIDTETLEQIDKELISEIEIKIVLGTWCSDSQREVPRFYKIIDALALDKEQITMIGVNRLKMADETEVDNLEIELVPTIIFYYNANEIGRIVESPNESLEKDFLNIISSI